MAYKHTENALIMTFRAQEVLSEAYIVCVLGTAENEVKKPAAVTDTPLGVTQDTAAAVGDSVPVQMDGVTKVVANGAFSKGDQLAIAATSGRVDTVSGLDSSFDNSGGPNTAQKPLGIALEAATTSGQIVSMLIRPFFYPWS